MSYPGPGPYPPNGPGAPGYAYRPPAEPRPRRSPAVIPLAILAVIEALVIAGLASWILLRDDEAAPARLASPVPETTTVTVTPSSPATTSVPVGISREDVADWLGDWTGAVDQPGARDYSVNLTLAYRGGAVTGTVEYPELRCSGTLGSARLVGDVLHLTETIDPKQRGSCLSPVPLELTLRPDEIKYHFDDGGAVGDAVLRRP